MLQLIRAAAAALLLVGAAVAQAGPASAQPAVPGPPANLRVTNLQPEQFTVAWDPVPGAIEYQVRALGSAFAPWDTTQELTSTWFALWDTSYQVTVRAFVAIDHEPWTVYTEFSAPLTVTTPMPPDFELPSAPRNLRVERNNQGQITLIRWDPPVAGYGQLRYNLYFETPAEPEDLSGIWPANGDGTADPSQNPLGAELYGPGQVITIRVTAVDRKNNESPPSEPLVLTCCPF
jgi:hypothetical protein